MEKDDEVLKRIKELLPQAPVYWVDVIAKQMGKTKDSVYAYVRGDRGMRKGQHKEVLRLLKDLVEKESKKDEALLS